MNTTDFLTNFIHQERSRFSDKRNNLVAFSFGHVIRYHAFLQITLKRYKEASKKFMENIKQFQKHTKGKGGKMGDELQAIWEKGHIFGDKLHLQIESFYLFSKIMLDKIAQSVENYFGSEKGISLVSHHKLSKDFAKYAEKKGLSNPPESLLKLIDDLQKKVCDFRDKIITHTNNPRSIKGTMFRYDTGEAWISEHKVYPKNGELQNEGLAPTQLIKLLEHYIVGMTNYIWQNRDKAKLI